MGTRAPPPSNYMFTEGRYKTQDAGHLQGSPPSKVNISCVVCIPWYSPRTPRFFQPTVRTTYGQPCLRLIGFNVVKWNIRTILPKLWHGIRNQIRAREFTRNALSMPSFFCIPSSLILLDAWAFFWSIWWLGYVWKVINHFFYHRFFFWLRLSCICILILLASFLDNGLQ